MKRLYVLLSSVFLSAIASLAEGQRGVPPKKPIHPPQVKPFHSPQARPIHSPYQFYLHYHWPRPTYPYRTYPYRTYPYPLYYSYPVPYYVYRPEYIYVPNYYQPPVTSTLPPNVPATAVLPPPQSNQAVVCAVLPTSTAKVWFDGVATADNLNTVRCYNTPDLPLGEKFHYHVKAEWLDRGARVIQDRIVRVEAGGREIVDFTKPADK